MHKCQDADYKNCFHCRTIRKDTVVMLREMQREREELGETYKAGSKNLEGVSKTASYSLFNEYLKTGKEADIIACAISIIERISKWD